MTVTIAHTDECETNGDWKLVRRTLGVGSFGVNVVDIPPGGRIPEHDETARDQEELFFVVAGAPTLVVDGESHPLTAGTFARIDPEHRRTVRNDAGEPARVLIASAPTDSGYEPMDWA